MKVKVKSTCSNCGKEINIEEVNEKMEAYKCPYCKTEYLLKVARAKKKENPTILPMFVGAGFILALGSLSCIISMIVEKFGR